MPGGISLRVSDLRALSLAAATSAQAWPSGPATAAPDRQSDGHMEAQSRS